MKKVILIFLSAILILSVSACSTAANITTEKWELSAFNTFLEENPPEDGGTNDILQTGKTAEGKYVFAVIRMELGAQWLVNEISSAKLFLKPEGTNSPKTLTVTKITGGWDVFFTPRSEIEKLFSTERRTCDVTTEEEGWISISITDEIKAWIGGSFQNNGIALETRADDPALYTYSYDEGSSPYLLVSGAVGTRSTTYGKFGYKEMETVDDAEIVGNCLS
jgi:hypothetical protein